MKRAIISVALVVAVLSASAVEWRNLDAEHYLGGVKVSNGYLQGKVVLVDRWGAKCPPCRKALPRVEEVWQSFKTKPFVVLGGHCAGSGSSNEVQKLIKENSLSYAVYEDAGLRDGEPKFNDIPYFYVVDALGKVVYQGHDLAAATEAAVIALTDEAAPPTAAKFGEYFDAEVARLPGRAYLRMLEFKKKHPKAAKGYAEKFKELSAIPNIKKLAELVDTARRAKDSKDLEGKSVAKRKRLQDKVSAAISKFTSLKEAEDPRVCQEAKNALADLIRLKTRF